MHASVDTTLPDAEIVTLEGAGHMVLTRPTAVADHVRRWVRRTRLAVVRADGGGRLSG